MMGLIIGMPYVSGVVGAIIPIRSNSVNDKYFSTNGSLIQVATGYYPSRSYGEDVTWYWNGGDEFDAIRLEEVTDA